MTDFPFITNGPWQIRPGVFDGDAAISYHDHDGESELVASESHADLALLRDAITEYLQAVEESR